MIVFLLVMTAAAGAGFVVLRALGFEPLDAWALGRVVGPFLCALPAWWSGVAGFPAWSWVFAVCATLGGVGAVRHVLRSKSWRPVVVGESVFWGASLLVLLMRWGQPNILGTEKLMDLGILASMLRSDAFPPPDMWLAGESLPYYYLGGLPWASALEISGLPLELGYNLIVALIGGWVFTAVWTLASRLSGDRWLGAVGGAFFATFAGTPDGLRQWISGQPMGGLNLWESSRQVSDTITEFPLFTLWLGDLHPHLLAMPLAVAAVAVALEAARRWRWWTVVLAGVLFGMTWAANPWALPPTFLGAGLMLLTGDGRWSWPWQDRRRRWLGLAVLGASGFAATAPFHLGFDPPSRPVKFVFTWTDPVELLLYAGALLVPAAVAAWRTAVRRDGESAHQDAALVLSAAAILVVGGTAFGRTTAAVIGLVFLVFALASVRRDERPDRAGIALAALALFLFVVPEFVYLEDGYGRDLHRMNTVFKAYIQGWVFLAAALPCLILRVGWRQLLLAVMIVVSAPHLVSATLASVGAASGGLDGFEWMGETDRVLVERLRQQPRGTALVEAVGGAYTEYARLSSGSGVPAVLGWANHEMVWRGNEINPETDRRRRLVETIYTSGQPDRIRQAVEELEADVVAIGRLEQRDFAPEHLLAIRETGDRVESIGEGHLVFFSFGGAQTER